jgi:antirestriction protein ArdC
MSVARVPSLQIAHSSYARITDELIALLNAGVVPWRRPWTTQGPRNLISRRPYRGINVLVLACQGRPSPWWLTYRQAVTLGGGVRQGEHGTQVVFWRVIEPPETAPDTAPAPRRVVLRTYTVFHESQCDLPAAAAPTDDTHALPPIHTCEQVIDGLTDPPHIVTGSDVACYLPVTDTIHIPRRGDFASPEAYYATLFHELAHATGHPRRLNRSGLTTPAPFGSPDYSHEELVAEMTSAFVCGATGIAPATLPGSAEYIGGWLRALRAESRLVVVAAGQAQRAADLLLGAAAAPHDETPGPRNIPRGSAAHRPAPHRPFKPVM